MKTKLLLHYLQNLKWSIIRPVTAGFLLILALSPEPCALSQIPQGFNYQAIARDGSGNPITGANLQVKIGILSDTIANTMVWEELFNPVITNAFGMFNIVVGTGVKQSGSAVTFSVIDWTKPPLFLRTSIYYPSSWKVMGTTKLQSVPYSIVAGNLEGTVPLLSVKGNTTTMDSALFVVRNNTGQIVFAVYNEGVRIYVDDGVAKGATKGGFAIGSFNKAKGTTQDYFIVTGDSIRAYIDTGLVKARKGGFAIGSFDKSKAGSQDYFQVTHDSIRMYINDLATKATKGGFAIGGFNRSKGGNTNFLNVSTDASGIINPSQNRILWYPLKNAFLVGRIRIATPDSVGVNSFATGYESKARGKYSQAMGYKAIANGDYSTSIGKYSVANNINSFAFGDSAIASETQTYAFGYKTVASGMGSLALGYKAYASGQDAFALGSGTEATQQGSYALGFVGRDSAGIATGNTKATAPWAVAIGMGAQAKRVGAFSIGIQTIADGDYCLALGYKASSLSYSTAIGYSTSSTGGYSTAIGYWTKANGYGSIALGNGAITSGVGSSAIGLSTSASGNYSTSLGGVTKAIGEGSTAMGWNTLASGTYSTASGYFATASGNYGSVSMGNNTTASGWYSVSMGNGSVAGGGGSIAAGNGTTANGWYSVALGNNTKAIGTSSTSLGESTTASGSWSTVMGLNSIASGNVSTSIGFDTKATAEGSISMGWSSKASANYSMAIGNFLTANSFRSIVLGISNDTTCSASGRTSWVSTDPLFVVGNGQIFATGSNAITVLKNGNTAIGHALPTQMLDVNGNARFRSIGSGAYVGAVNRTTDGTLTTATSDIRSKDNISTLTNSLNAILNLRGIFFTWKNEPEMGRRIGLIAQEVEPILPELVFTNPADGLKGVN